MIFDQDKAPSSRTAHFGELGLAALERGSLFTPGRENLGNRTSYRFLIRSTCLRIGGDAGDAQPAEC